MCGRGLSDQSLTATFATGPGALSSLTFGCTSRCLPSHRQGCIYIAAGCTMPNFCKFEPVFIANRKSCQGSSWLPWNPVVCSLTGRLCTNGWSEAVASTVADALFEEAFALWGWWCQRWGSEWIGSSIRIYLGGASPCWLSVSPTLIVQLIRNRYWQEASGVPRSIAALMYKNYL